MFQVRDLANLSLSVITGKSNFLLSDPTKKRRIKEEDKQNSSIIQEPNPRKIEYLEKISGSKIQINQLKALAKEEGHAKDTLDDLIKREKLNRN